MTTENEIHLGQLLKEKIMEQEITNHPGKSVIQEALDNAAAEIQTLKTELTKYQELTVQLNTQLTQSKVATQDALEQVEKQRERTLEWYDHSNKVSPLYDAVVDTIREIMYGEEFKTHLFCLVQERVDIALEQDVGVDYTKLNDHIDYDKLASKIDLGELASDHIDIGDLASHVASEIDTSDVACELDLSEIAGHIDVSDVADNVSCSDIASELAQRVRVNVDFSY